MGRKCRRCVELLTEVLSLSISVDRELERWRKGLIDEEEMWSGVETLYRALERRADECRDCLAKPHAKGVFTRGRGEIGKGLERRSVRLVDEGSGRIWRNASTWWTWHVADTCQREAGEKK